MAELAAGLLATRAFQALRRARQAVARWRFPAIVTVLGQARLQVLHTGQQPRHLLVQRGVLGFQLGEAFLWRHEFMLHLLCKSASYHGGRAGENGVRLGSSSSVFR